LIFINQMLLVLSHVIWLVKKFLTEEIYFFIEVMDENIKIICLGLVSSWHRFALESCHKGI